MMKVSVREDMKPGDMVIIERGLDGERFVRKATVQEAHKPHSYCVAQLKKGHIGMWVPNRGEVRRGE